MCYKQKQDIGHVCIYKETWRRYHELFIIYYTNKKNQKKFNDVFSKRKKPVTNLRPSLSNISILPFQDRNTKAIDCLALSLSLNSKKRNNFQTYNKNKKNFISKISEIYKNTVILVNFFKD